MEITELNLIGDFEAGIKCLQNPSLISKFSSIDKIPQFYSFWTYGALILAVFAAFTNVFNRIKLLIHHIRLKFVTYCQKSCPQHNFDHDDFDFDFSDDDGDDDTPSSVAESDDEEMDSEDGRVGESEVFRAEGHDGNFSLRRRNGFSWSDFSAGKSVVQMWDSFGLGFDESEYGSEIWDMNLNFPATATAENVVLMAEMNDGNGRVGFGKSPAIYTAWQPRQRKIWFDGDGGAGEKEE